MARKKKTDEDESLNQNVQNDSDDTFGLPDIEYKPLNREEETSVESSEIKPEEETQPAASTYENVQKPMEQQPEYTYDPEEESAPVWPKVIGILLVLAVALGAAWYFISYRPAQQEKARLEKERLEQEAKKEQDRLAEEQRLRDEAAQRKADSLANIPKTGAFEVLTERTSRYYVIV
ncbi:MAG TPA: hypothetical protein VFU05_08770, partial [Cyclobacteriaceae bacterium]|nr:hypothetical protein [Cyclobacteriaceae bacterium]